jgi:VanZ family protein
MAHVPVPLTVRRSSGVSGATDASGRSVVRSDHRPCPPIAVRWIVNAIYAAVLAALAVVPPGPLTIGPSVPDWLAHAVAYGIQAGLLFWAVPATATTRSRARAGLTGAVAFGAATEALQLLQPARSTELVDLVANGLGAAISVVAISLATNAAARIRR